MLAPHKQFQLTSVSGQPILISLFGEVPYQLAHKSMMAFAESRGGEEIDQIWLLQHPPVYTQGTSCTQDTLLGSDIPIQKTDRGGQITYHGPGQIVMYPLLKLKNFGLGVKALVSALEQSVINVLVDYDVNGERREDAPGVYVNQAKIAALGLRIKRGTSYHGLSFNIDMDLSPFANIDPCGFQGLQVTQLVELNGNADLAQVQNQLLQHFVRLI